MPILTFLGESYSCARAQKGGDYVRLLDDNNEIVFFADGITDFSSYVLTGGEWETPVAVVAPTVGALAALEGGVVKLTLPDSVKVETDLQINFKAPCSCSAVNGLNINGVNYTVVDTLGNCVTGKGGAWVSGALVSVILDAEGQKAYLQNISGYNREETMTEETAAEFGLGSSGTPNDALFYLGKYSQHWWRRKAAQNTILEGYAGLEIINTGTFSKSIIYSSTINPDYDKLTVSLGSGEKYLSITNSNFSQHETLLAPLSGKYVEIDGVVYRYVGYSYEEDYDGDGNDGIYLSLRTLTPVNTVGEWLYVRSHNKDDYPESGTSGDFYYQYLGVPFDNAIKAVSIDQLAEAITEGVNSV